MKISVYRRLNDTLHGPAAAALLDDVELSDAVLRIAEQIAEDPVLLAARRAIGSSSNDLNIMKSGTGCTCVLSGLG